LPNFVGATENILFEEALRLLEELKEFIMGIRYNKISYETQMEKLQSMLQQAKTVKEFYNKEPDLDIFYRIENEMKILLDIN
jgi:hypothetical protein